ncbi:MAG TPA: type II toxin-antitoxin system VapC family toxin [Rhodothermales bacterium]|nr:type II toxin-antitoxin system VapC family toxin [Rhodothermales bacterium]
MAERLLLDTHALIWALADPDELSTASRDAIESPATTVLVSPASVYEINLKVALGKLHAPAIDLVSSIAAVGFTELPLRLAHAALAGCLSFHHRDPFDRLLIAQAQLEDLTVVTRDTHFTRYGLSVLAC